MLHLILWIAIISRSLSFSQGAVTVGGKENEPDPVVPSPISVSTENVEPVMQAKSDELRLMLKSVDLARNLWRDDEKGGLFQVFRVSDSDQPEVRHEGLTPGLILPPNIIIPQPQLREIEGLTSDLATQTQQDSKPHSHNIGANPVRRHVKDRAGRTFWPFVSWWSDPCYYGDCYPPPPPPYYPYGQPPPPPYYY